MTKNERMIAEAVAAQRRQSSQPVTDAEIEAEFEEFLGTGPTSPAELAAMDDDDPRPPIEALDAAHDSFRRGSSR